MTTQDAANPPSPTRKTATKPKTTPPALVTESMMAATQVNAMKPAKRRTIALVSVIVNSDNRLTRHEGQRNQSTNDAQAHQATQGGRTPELRVGLAMQARSRVPEKSTNGDPAGQQTDNSCHLTKQITHDRRP